MPVRTPRPRQNQGRPNFKRPGRKIPRLIGARRPGPPLRTRGPRPFIKAVEQTDAPGLPPPTLTATLPEWYVYWWLEKRRNLKPGLDFEFQSSLLGGRQELGGLVLDFFLPNFFNGLAINVQGYHWHRESTSQRADDLSDKLRLIALGYTVVYCLEDDLLRSLDGTMQQAMRGIQLYPDTV